jgi:hypothetical protein
MLDIGVGDELGKPPSESEPRLGLDNDGYYWFLHPHFEKLRSETGQYIDLYGDVAFVGANLDALERMLTDARRMVESQPTSWKVHTGTQTAPVRREIHQPVERAEFLRLFDVWQQVIDRARQTGRPVVFFGD